MHNPEAEKRLWKIVGPLRLWPRWYLKAFARLYALENMTEYERVRKRRYRKGKAVTEAPAKLKAIREQAARRLTAHPEDGRLDG